MALVATHRQVVYRLLPQTRSSWRRLERTLEDQRQLYNVRVFTISDGNLVDSARTL